MPRTTRPVLMGLALAVVSTPTTGNCIEAFCNPVDMCSWVPRYPDTGAPIYNRVEGTGPWVIGGSDVVSLAAGSHDVGGGSFRVVFVIESATLEVKDLPNDWAGFGAFLVLCDQATFRVENAGFRTLADWGFQYPIFAFGQSSVVYSDARIYTLTPEREANGETGHLMQVMGGHSQLVTTHPLTTTSVSFPASNGAWELAATQSSSVHVGDMWAFAELYVQGQAELSIADSSFFDVFFEVCPGDDYTLTSLPALCDLTDPVNGCITAGHQPIDFSISPPTTPFTLNMVNVKPFSWAVSTHAGSSAHVAHVPALANLAVGLGGIRDDMQIRLTTGPSPVMEGITDRVLQFDDVTVNGGWMVWPVGASHTTILPGSEVGDLLPGDTATIEVDGSLVRGAMFRASAGTAIRLVDTTVDEPAANTGGKLWAVRSAFNQVVRFEGATWLADTDVPTSFTYTDAASLFQVRLTTPADSSSTFPSDIPIEGLVAAQQSLSHVMATMDPFPAAHLDLFALADGTVERLATITAMSTGGPLGRWDATAAAPGEYELRLYFAGSDGEQAVSRRRITILDRCAGVVCSALGPCHEVGACQSSTGTCTNPPKGAAEPCDDGNACTLDDQCDGAGACRPGAPKTCEALGPCFDQGACASATGACSPSPKPPGVACDDGDPCTTDDRCDGLGACTSSTRACSGESPSGSVHSVGGCSNTPSRAVPRVWLWLVWPALRLFRRRRGM